MQCQSSAQEIRRAIDIWAASVIQHGGDVPWQSAEGLYATIDAIQLGNAPWALWKVQYQGLCPKDMAPKWMDETYEPVMQNTSVVLQNMLATTEFKGKINYTPYCQFDSPQRRVWSKLMSGDWA